MKRYKITTRAFMTDDMIIAENPEKALKNWACIMDTDMNMYFKAIEVVMEPWEEKLDHDFYEIYEKSNTKWIHVFGYVYHAPVDGDNDYRNLEYCGFDLPLEEFLSKDFDYDSYQSGIKQYIGDITEMDAKRIVERYMAVESLRMCPYDMLTLYSENGYYVEG